jgi:DNA-directed RNA polymerase subunit beta
MLNKKNKFPHKTLLPNLLEHQKTSYCWFLEKGFLAEISDFSGIKSCDGNFKFDYITEHYKIKTPGYTLTEAKRRKISYNIAVFIAVQLTCTLNSKFTQSNSLLAHIPLMTEAGTFLVNGVERVVISQLIRSPGLYYKTLRNKQEMEIVIATIIPKRGVWVDFEFGSGNFIWVRIGRSKKFQHIFSLKH